MSGHTVGHVAYLFPDARAAFTGDSLMALGCGRVFEGTFPMMHETLSKFRGLPEDMRIYSGHEYTEGNARFAITVDPGNADLERRTEEILALRAEGRPTVPSLLGTEFRTNPFLRCHVPGVKSALGMEGASDADVFEAIRRRKGQVLNDLRTPARLPNGRARRPRRVTRSGRPRVARSARRSTPWSGAGRRSNPRVIASRLGRPRKKTLEARLI